MNIIKFRKVWILISIAMVVVSIPLIFIFKPTLGIDFTGGTLIELKPKSQISAEQMRSKIQAFSQKRTLIIQESGQNQYVIRTNNLDANEYKDFENKLNLALDNPDILRHEAIGGSVGKATTRNAIYAIIIAGFLIICYLAAAFRKVPKSVSPWAFGTIAFVTLIHDLSFSFAVFSVIGKINGYELDSTILVAALTILGFSVHDTIVVFDRIRENIIKNPQRVFSENCEISINQTIARSLNTSLGAILVLISMLLLGGSTIKPFVLMLALGIGIGTYSSIFVASPVLVIYHSYINKRTQKGS